MGQLDSFVRAGPAGRINSVSPYAALIIQQVKEQYHTITNVIEHESPWFFGTYGFVLANARPFEKPVYRGSLGLFNVPVSVVASEIETRNV